MGLVSALSAFVCMTFLPGLGVCAVAAEMSAATLSACLSMRLLPHTPHATAPESRRTTTIPCLPPGKRFTNAAVLQRDGVCSAIGACALSGGPVRQPALRIHSLFRSFSLFLRILRDWDCGRGSALTRTWEELRNDPHPPRELEDEDIAEEIQEDIALQGSVVRTFISRPFLLASVLNPPVCEASRSFTTNQYFPHAQMAQRSLSQPQHFIRFISLGVASCFLPVGNEQLQVPSSTEITGNGSMT